jgi:hypothetical protein
MPLVIAGATSGSTTVQATDAVTATITLPSATDTLVGKATTDTLTNKTLTLPVVGTTIGVGGATPSASGAGITFPATQSASTNANTLDDYEEGTWTPVIGGATSESGQTYSYRAGTYTRIGNTVVARFDVRASVKGTITGELQIKGFPFTMSGGNYGNISFYYNMASNTTYIALQGTNGTAAYVVGMTTASTALSYFTGANIANDIFLQGTIVYQAT